MNRRNHFTVWEWLDFFRGASDSTRTARHRMQDHLSSGCKRCNGFVRVLRGFAERASIEAGFEPPAGIVRRAEAILPRRRPGTTTLGRLVYDSFQQPLPAGMRAEERLARHALYEADDLVVDLQLEHEPGTGTVTLVGQISDREKPGVATTTLPVLLMAAKGLVTSATCNRLGEFEMEYKAVRDLRMYVPLRETGVHLELRMDELAPMSARRTRPQRFSVANSGKAPAGTRSRKKV
jgi:hypothetical protein